MVAKKEEKDQQQKRSWEAAQHRLLLLRLLLLLCPSPQRTPMLRIQLPSRRAFSLGAALPSMPSAHLTAAPASKQEIGASSKEQECLPHTTALTGGPSQQLSELSILRPLLRLLLLLLLLLLHHLLFLLLLDFQLQ
jgi:hypothetical protein